MMNEEMNQMTQEELIALAKKQDPRNLEPCIVMEERLPLDAPPAHVRTKRACELFDIRPGETLYDTLKRMADEEGVGHAD